MSKNKVFICAILLVLVALLAAYANHFNNEFHFDDSHTIETNVHIRTLKNIPAFFSDPKMFSSDPEHWGLRPVVTTSLAIDYWLGGSLAPFYFHLSTFLWFIFLGVLLFFVYKKLLADTFQYPWINYFVLFMVAWFMLHTANAETINYVISRSDVLSTLCIVASFLIYTGSDKGRKWYLYLIPAVIGVFAKETVLVLVILLFFYNILFEKKLALTDVFKGENFKLVWSAFVKVLPVLIVVALVQVYTLSKVASVPGITNPFGYYVLTQSYVWLHYFIAFFLPMNLSADTDWTVIQNAFDERIISGLIFVGVLFVAIFKTSAKVETRPVSFGLIWFSAALLPTSLAPFAEVTNDHRMFFPFIGLALSVVSWIGLWLMKYEKNIASSTLFRSGIAAAVLLILGLNAYGVHERNKIWKSEASLWHDVTLKSPLNGRGLMNYGLTQMAVGNYSGAAISFDRASSLLPYYSTLFINMGILNGALGKDDLAVSYFKKAISLAPNAFESYVYYGRFLNNRKRYAEAVQMAEKGLVMNSFSTLAMDELMQSYHDLGEWTKLVNIAKQKLAVLPEDALARKYLQAGRHRTPTVQVTPVSEKVKPLTAADYLNISLNYYNTHKYELCIETCLLAIKLKPDYADAYSNMGASYNQLKQWDKGIAACENALKIDPGHVLAKGNLDWAKQGRAGKAGK